MQSVAAPTLLQRRCTNHPDREASARCPECGRFYCRECITEHDDRVLCAGCLARTSLKKEEVRHRWAWLPRAVLGLVSFAIIYLFFVLVGRLFLSVPSSFHPSGGW